jgi:hypothetical protein
MFRKLDPEYRDIQFSKRLSSYLEFWTIDKIHKPSDSERKTRGLSRFRFRSKAFQIRSRSGNHDIEHNPKWNPYYA